MSAREWFKNLSPDQKFQLGDDSVLGSFDWHEWFEHEPSSKFLREVERERLLWESTGD